MLSESREKSIVGILVNLLYTENENKPITDKEVIHFTQEGEKFSICGWLGVKVVSYI